MHATYIYSPKDNKYLEVVNSDRFGELFNVHIEVIGENKYNASFFMAIISINFLNGLRGG